MNDFPGFCEWCGGPREWTLADDDTVWVRCLEGCTDVQLVMPGFEDELVATPDGIGLMERSGRSMVGPPEGGETETSLTEVEWPGEVPRAFLNSLWEGEYGEV